LGDLSHDDPKQAANFASQVTNIQLFVKFLLSNHEIVTTKIGIRLMITKQEKVIQQ
jgi:hypothetical protein